MNCDNKKHLLDQEGNVLQLEKGLNDLGHRHEEILLCMYQCLWKSGIIYSEAAKMTGISAHMHEYALECTNFVKMLNHKDRSKYDNT